MRYMISILLFTLVLPVHAETFQPFILEEGKECFQECKPRKQVLGLFGSKEEGLDRASCVACIEKHPEKFKFNSTMMRPGSACYKSCKPSGIGINKKEGVEREGCVSCLFSHPELYKIAPSVKVKSLQCEVSYDEMTVTCENGHTYKRDTSAINDVERSFVKETEKQKNGKKRSESGAQRQ